MKYTSLHRAFTILVAAAVAGVGVVAAAPTAAMADYRDCPANYVCLWGDASYTGRYLFVLGGQGVPNIGNAMNDLTTSIWNRTGTGYCFYYDINYQSRDSLFIPAGGSSPAIGYMNDKISSFNPKPTNESCI